MPYSAASVPLTDALDESAYSVSFYEDSYSLPQLMIDEDDMTIGEALDKNLWSLFSTYLDYDALGFPRILTTTSTTFTTIRILHISIWIC